MRAWTLRDILHVGGLPPMEDRAANGAFVAVSAQKDASLVDKTSVFQIQNHDQGLPMSLGVVVQRVLLRAIKRDVANGVLQWRAPITMGRSMSISLRNRLAPFESANHYFPCYLRISW